MKKIFLFAAAMMAAVAMNAQKVTPLEELKAQFQLDTMRVIYANNPAGMLVELQTIQETQKADAQMLKDAAKQLKDETAYSKSLAKYAKTSLKAAQSLQKNYTSEQKSLQSAQQAVNDLQNDLLQYTSIQDEHKDKMNNDIREQNSQINQCLNNVNDLLRNINTQEQYLNNQINALAQYDADIKTKSEKLKEMQAIQKENEKQIKDELKVWKAAAKAQK